MDRERDERSLEDRGIPDVGRPHPLQRDTGDEGLLPPGDEPAGVDETGTTATEQREGTPLDERLAEEEPEGRGAGRPRVGRLRERGWGLTDQEKDEVAEEAEDDVDGATAEEAAMRIDDEPGGVTDAPDSYVEDSPP
jgi:hypothetical protein